jgi:peptidoglycan/LPS O-acetylase OafA/YrhL
LKLTEYIRGVNGLRAIAATAVLLSHVSDNWGIFKLGWVGVDMFFVISGFLITKILIENHKSRNYFKAFYLNRALRIFPVYFLVVIPLVVFHLYKNAVPAYVPFSYLCYLQNSFALNYGWLSGLNHTWTLAIEEQFYLFFPVVVFLIPRKYLMKTFIAVIAVIFMLRFFFFLNRFPIYYQSVFTISRLDGFLLGGLIALIGTEGLKISKEKWNVIFNILGFASFICLCVMIIYFGNSATGFWNKVILGFDNFKANSNAISAFGHTKYTLLALLFASLLGKIAFQTSNFSIYVANLLERPFIRKVGEMSYGIYLYHYVYVSFFRYVFHLNECSPFLRLVLIIVIIVATYATAYLSLHYFEKPILKFKKSYLH